MCSTSVYYTHTHNNTKYVHDQRAAVFEVLLTYHHVSHGKNMLVAVATCHYRPIHLKWGNNDG